MTYDEAAKEWRDIQGFLAKTKEKWKQNNYIMVITNDRQIRSFRDDVFDEQANCLYINRFMDDMDLSEEDRTMFKLEFG